jgi:hypothetical protein
VLMFGPPPNIQSIGHTPALRFPGPIGSTPHPHLEFVPDLYARSSRLWWLIPDRRLDTKWLWATRTCAPARGA